MINISPHLLWKLLLVCFTFFLNKYKHFTWMSYSIFKCPLTNFKNIRPWNPPFSILLLCSYFKKNKRRIILWANFETKCIYVVIYLQVIHKGMLKQSQHIILVLFSFEEGKKFHFLGSLWLLFPYFDTAGWSTWTYNYSRCRNSSRKISFLQ